jgi:hypothetical protein
MYIPIHVPNVTQLTDAGLTHIELQRDDGSGYVSITTAVATAPSVTGTRWERFDLEDKELLIYLDEAWYTVSFTDPNPYTASEAVAFVSISGLTASDVGGYVELAHDTVGISSVLKIGDATANDNLGFEVDTHYGTDAHIALTTDTFYYFTDPNGTVSSDYRYRFINDGVYSDWISLTTEDGWDVTGANVCLCYINAVDTDYTSLDDKEVKLSNIRSADGIEYEDKYLAGVSQTFTISDGFGCMFLPRGQMFDMSVDGTGLVRRITVPDDTEVDLLDSTISEGDYFEVQTFNPPSAIRRS